LDDPTQTVVMHRSEPSRLQSLALQLTDKINNFVDSNERIFEMKQGLSFQEIFKEDIIIVNYEILYI
jgi:translation initiation factor 3 subunit C